MNPEIKARWVAKLREEGRRQTRGRLRDASGAQCCLDVLCEVAVEDNVIDPPVLDGERFIYVSAEHGRGGEFLPIPVRNWAGLIYCSPDVRINGALYGLTELNDELSKTFSEIADFIEADEDL